MPVEAVVVGLPMALGLGLVYGLGPCLISCLPYLGPVFLANERGIRESWRIVLPISLGRLTVYSVFGCISGWVGQKVLENIDARMVQITIGVATLMVGIALFLRLKTRSGCATAHPSAISPIRRMERLEKPQKILPVGLYLMGVGMALNPCAPMSVVLVSAAATGDAVSGGMLGFSFGLGAIAAPAIVYGLGVAYFGQQLRGKLGCWLPRLEKASAVLFVFVGVSQLVRL